MRVRFATWGLVLLGACASSPPEPDEPGVPATAESAQEPGEPGEPEAPAAAQDPGAQPASGEQSFDVVFEGADSFPGFRLERVIEDLLILFGRDPSRESLIFDGAVDLQDHYIAQGFPEARVDYRVERSPALKVIFEVSEGPLVTVTDLKIEGATTFPVEELVELWSRRRSGVLGFGDPYFVEADLVTFGLSMRAKYADRGLLDVEVDGPIVERAEGSETAQVRFVISEGERYTLTGVRLVDEIARLVDVGAGMVGKPYDPIATRSLRVHVRQELRNHGYPDPSVRMSIEVDREHKTVEAEISGDPGTRSRIAEIAIEGLDRTRRWVVEREIEFAAGEWFDGSKIEETVQELYLSGLFRRVEIDQVERGPGELAITVRLEEEPAREVSFLVGYGAYEAARGGVFFTDRNLFGTGQSLRLGGRVSTKSYRVDATWTEPKLFGTDNILAITTFMREREEPSFTDFSLGASAAVTRRLFQFTQARVGYSFQARDATEVDPTFAGLENEFDISTVFFELSRDNRDSQIYPNRGNRQILRYEIASEDLGGEVNFDRLTAQFSWHHSFAEDWILSLAAQTGLIWPGDAGGLPVQERFYNGGDASVRSFKESELGPLTATGAPAGGEFRNIFNAEVKFPMFKAFKGAVFADAGNVGTSVGGYGLSDLRYALGAGLRLALPIGPVRLDVGWNPDPKSFERDYRVHLTVGLPF